MVKDNQEKIMIGLMDYLVDNGRELAEEFFYPYETIEFNLVNKPYLTGDGFIRMIEVYVYVDDGFFEWREPGFIEEDGYTHTLEFFVRAVRKAELKDNEGNLLIGDDDLIYHIQDLVSSGNLSLGIITDLAVDLEDGF